MIFVGVWLACAVILIKEKEEVHTSAMTSISPNRQKGTLPLPKYTKINRFFCDYVVIFLDAISIVPERLRVTLSGSFDSPNCLSQNGIDAWVVYGKPDALTNVSLCEFD